MMEPFKKNVSSEDTVHTLFFSAFSNVDVNYWQELCEQINSSVNILSKGYIWHRDKFQVSVPILNAENCVMPMHLIATTCFGDNIEDEWFIVYLIFELSKQFKDLIIQIADNDGDFILIEAADHLPSWANPENTENRVFISNYNIHLIPPDIAVLKNNLNIIDALQLIAKYSRLTIASSDIQTAILNRISQYPEKITETIHKAIVYLPVHIAALLTLQPSLIAPIVAAYCHHDMIDLKACKNLMFTDCTYAEIKFTKFLYAMLIHSKLIRSGHIKNSAEEKKKELGIKITYGYQMLMQTLVSDIFSTKDYVKFKNNLKRNGYFKNNIEDSKEYNTLMENAKKYYRDVECPITTYVANQVTEITATDEYMKCKESLKLQNNTCKGLTEDSDEWLNVQPSQLNDLLNNRYGNNMKFYNDDLITPDKMTSKLAEFLKQSSDYEGVETKKNNDFDDESINFDANEFLDCLENMTNFVSGNVNSSMDQDTEYESDDVDDELNGELSTKLNSYEENRNDKHRVMFNLTQSIKEEGLSGPTSNLLSSIGISKKDLLDSDDDD